MEPAVLSYPNMGGEQINDTCRMKHLRKKSIAAEMDDFPSEFLNLVERSFG